MTLAFMWGVFCGILITSIPVFIVIQLAVRRRAEEERIRYQHMDQLIEDQQRVIARQAERIAQLESEKATTKCRGQRTMFSPPRNG